MIKKKLISFFSYNYFAQKVLNYIFFFKLRNFFIKCINFFFKRYSYEKVLKDKLNYTDQIQNGWSIIILTYNLKKNLNLQIKAYKKIFKSKKYEIIILTNFNRSNISIKGVRLVNLNSNSITLGKKRNLGILLANYSKIIMSLDYFSIDKFILKKIEKEILKNDLLVPKIETIDKKRYLDWLTLDYPKIGKSLFPYNLKDKKYMYFHGSYFIFNRKFIRQNLFSNFLDHQQGEDVDWSLKVRKKIKFSLSKNISMRVERFSYESEVLNDKNFQKNCENIIKNA